MKQNINTILEAVALKHECELYSRVGGDDELIEYVFYDPQTYLSCKMAVDPKNVVISDLYDIADGFIKNKF